MTHGDNSGHRNEGEKKTIGKTAHEPVRRRRNPLAAPRIGSMVPPNMNIPDLALSGWNRPGNPNLHHFQSLRDDRLYENISRRVNFREDESKPRANEVEISQSFLHSFQNMTPRRNQEKPPMEPIEEPAKEADEEKSGDADDIEFEM